MAIQYGNKFVDDRFQSIVEPNLFYDNIFIPGVTFTDKYQLGAAGQILVHKPGIDKIDPGAPGRDFSDVDKADTLVTISLQNNFQRSRKIYGVQANAVAFPRAEEEMSLAIQEVSEGWQISAAASLIDTAPVLGGGVPDTTALTVSNVRNYFLQLRKALREAKARPSACLVSATVYSLILEEAGNEFVPSRNDQLNASGVVGTWYGIPVLEATMFAEAAAKYRNDAGVEQTIDLTTVDMVMYDADAFSIVTNLEAMRLIDSENFTGSKAQVESNVGYKLTNTARAIKKVNA